MQVRGGWCVVRTAAEAAVAAAGVMFVAAWAGWTGRVRGFGNSVRGNGFVQRRRVCMHHSLSREEQVQDKYQYGNDMSAGGSHSWQLVVADNLM